MSAAWDEPAFGALVAELDAWRRDGRAAAFWWRDDDAGAWHPGLTRLLALAAAARVPLGLAVVPAWLTPETAAAIRRAPGALAVLQHGFAHANHETRVPPGDHKARPAECGGARPPEAVLAELAEGRDWLVTHLGPRLLPALVPPWNRIAPAVAARLPDYGYRALSTFGPRQATAPIAGLVQLNCHADPILWRQGRRFAGARAALDQLRSHLAARREARADATEATGLLSHHQVMDKAGWRFLEELWPRLLAHPAVRLPALPALLGLP